MKTNSQLIEKLFNNFEEYSKTGVELLTLKFTQKSSNILSKLIFYFLLIIVFSFFTIMLSIGISFWIGSLLGTIYYGFLIVAAFYGIIGCLLALTNTKILRLIRNSIIAQMFD